MPTSGSEPIILAFRGSRQPDALRSAADLARAVSVLRPGARVRSAFLDFAAPGLPAALGKEAGLGYREAVVVPVLLTAGYHARVRIPGEITAAVSAGLPLRVHLSAVLGPDADRQDDGVRSALVRALLRRVGATEARGNGRHSATGPWERSIGTGTGGIVLAAAGSRAARALAAVEVVAAALQAASGVPCASAYLTGSRPDVAQAVTGLRMRGARRVAVAAYFLTRGRYYARAAAEAWAAGADSVAEPLCDGPELAELVLHRVDAALAQRRL